LFHEAEGGTIFLDGIGSLPLPLQDRLIELLRHHHIRTPADGAPARVDVRVLAGSDAPLEAKVATGDFRGELFELLNSVGIVLPPLNERPEDIPLLVAHFLSGKIHSRSGTPCEMTREALEVCRAYRWPGNVRELENCLQHASLLCQAGRIQPSDLPRHVQQAKPLEAEGDVVDDQHSQDNAGACRGQCRQCSPSVETPKTAVDARPELVPLKRFLRDQEVSYLHRTLTLVGGSKERAAEVLGISLATIYRKLSEPSDTPESI
jgi:DNA-binding NtrC family response regulator